MATRRAKRITPIALLWTRRDQLRFTESVQRLVAATHDLQLALAELKREVVRRRKVNTPATMRSDNGTGTQQATNG